MPTARQEMIDDIIKVVFSMTFNYGEDTIPRDLVDRMLEMLTEKQLREIYEEYVG